MLTRQLHLAEDIVQEAVYLRGNSGAEGIENLLTTPDFPSLDGQLHHGGVVLMIAVAQEREHAIADCIADKLAMGLLPRARCAATQREFVGHCGCELEDLGVEVMHGLDYLLAREIVGLGEERLERLVFLPIGFCGTMGINAMGKWSVVVLTESVVALIVARWIV